MKIIRRFGPRIRILIRSVAKLNYTGRLISTNNIIAKNHLARRLIIQVTATPVSLECKQLLVCTQTQTLTKGLLQIILFQACQPIWLLDHLVTLSSSKCLCKT